MPFLPTFALPTIQSLPPNPLVTMKNRFLPYDKRDYLNLRFQASTMGRGDHLTSENTSVFVNARVLYHLERSFQTLS